MSDSQWASRDANPAAILETFQEGLPVQLIATSRAMLATCESGEELAAVVIRNRDNRFDYLPVVEGRDASTGIIVGMMEIAPFMADDAPAGLIADHMQPLSEAHLIGADASLLEFIRNADQRPCRLTVSGTDINGLVSLSDLQQLPVRAALFAMVTQLEMTMTDAIKARYGEPREWIKKLPPQWQKRVHREIARRQARDAFVDALLCTRLCEKAAILAKSPRFRGEEEELQDQFDCIRKLRNSLAHADDYAATPEAAANVCRITRMITNWIQRLAEAPKRTG